MRYKIREIDDFGLTIREALTPAWMAAECPDLEARPAPTGLGVRGRLEKTGDDSFLLRGQLGGALIGTCARCLEPARVSIDIPLTISFVEQDAPDEDADEDDAGTVNDPDVVSVPDGVIDLSPCLRDELMLAMPIGPLCKEDCGGICPVCGDNRNINPCDCAEKQRKAQSKFGVLSNLSLKD